MEKIVIQWGGSSGTLRKQTVEALGRKILSNSEDARVILFPGIGNSVEDAVIAADLALNLAEGGRKVLIIDTDMRRNKLTQILKPEKPGGDPIYGLSEYLSGARTIDDILCMTSRSGLCAVFSGSVTENPLDLLESERFPELINIGTRYFDYILIDCAPADRFRDAEIICTCVDALIPVVKWGTAESKRVGKVMAAFAEIGVPNLGCALYGVPSGKSLMGRYYAKKLASK